jgi:hypothetical protein
MTTAGVGALLRQARSALAADAVTLAVRQNGLERVLVCTSDGGVREASGSLTLGLVSRGPTRLSGGVGILQAAECCAVLGFTPTGYLGARFEERQSNLSGGIAAWSRGRRRWAAADGRRLRRLAAMCVGAVEATLES